MCTSFYIYVLFRKLSCTWHMYHFNYQVSHNKKVLPNWGEPERARWPWYVCLVHENFLWKTESLTLGSWYGTYVQSWKFPVKSGKPLGTIKADDKCKLDVVWTQYVVVAIFWCRVLLWTEPYLRNCIELCVVTVILTLQEKWLATALQVLTFLVDNFKSPSSQWQLWCFETVFPYKKDKLGSRL